MVLLFLNQIRMAISNHADASVYGVIVGTWLIPSVLGLFIARKFARENPDSVPWGRHPVASDDANAGSDVPSWMK